MKYSPKELIENVNISKKSPIKDLITLAGGIFLVLLLLYIILGFLVNVIIKKLPVDLEQKIIGRISFDFISDINKKKLEADKENYINSVLNSLTYELPENKRRHNVILISDSDIKNALALPGGTILLYSDLFDEFKSENELAFVLSHELGHYENRDHLKALGRGLVFVFISTSLFGTDSFATEFLLSMLSKAEMKFSQSQESSADLFALNLINKKYGHSFGATEFLENMGKDEKNSSLSYYFASHPFPKDRVINIEQAIKNRGYEVLIATPLKFK